MTTGSLLTVRRSKWSWSTTSAPELRLDNNLGWSRYVLSLGVVKAADRNIEVANNGFRDGFSNMNNTEASFKKSGGVSVDARKMNAVRAYFEWIPWAFTPNQNVPPLLTIGTEFDKSILMTICVSGETSRWASSSTSSCSTHVITMGPSPVWTRTTSTLRSLRTTRLVH